MYGNDYAEQFYYCFEINVYCIPKIVLNSKSNRFTGLPAVLFKRINIIVICIDIN